MLHRVAETHFDEWVAQRYELLWPQLFDPAFLDPSVDVLAELAGKGACLELGVGTGRVALPLSRRGVRVHGIELSEPMVRQLRDQDGASEVGVTLGDFATTTVEETFRLVYLLRNTITNLTTQDEQVACFVNAAEHLTPGGSFVIEVGVPALRLMPPGQRVVPFDVGEKYWAYDLYDCATQEMSSNYVDEDDGVARMWSVPFRYVWPSELDLMARIAGLRLAERWQDWDGTPFTHESTRHVSVWQKSG